FPTEIDRYIDKGELALINEVVRLDDEGQLSPDRIPDTAARNVGYIDLRRFVDIGVAALGGTIAARRRRGLKAEGLGVTNLQSTLERHGIRIERRVRYETEHG